MKLAGEFTRFAIGQARMMLRFSVMTRPMPLRRFVKTKLKLRSLKVAEHSFRARSCLRNSARAQILHKNKHGINTTIILFQFPRYLFYFCFTNEYNVLMVLLFYYKSMLEKVTMQRTQQFSAFVCYRKKPVKCSACVVSRKNCD